MENKCYEGLKKILKAQSSDEMKFIMEQYDAEELKEIIVLLADKLTWFQYEQGLMKFAEKWRT